MSIFTGDSTSERAQRREARIQQLQQERVAREHAIGARVPRLGEIRRLQQEIGMDLSRLVLRVPARLGKSFAELQQLSQELQAEGAELLRKHGISRRDLEVQWDCPACQNTGWLPPEKAGENTVYPSRKCQCLLREEIEDLYRLSGLTGPHRDQTFGQFDITLYPEEDQAYMSRVKAAAENFAQAVVRGQHPESVVLMGAVGRGKTFLCSAIGNAVVSGGKTVVYFTLTDYLDFLRLAMAEDDTDYRRGAARLLEADLIILDDLGAEKVTDFAAQRLFDLINHRMGRRLPIVVSTNLRPEGITEVYGDRIASRLLYGCDVWQVKGQDVRKVLRYRSG